MGLESEYSNDDPSKSFVGIAKQTSMAFSRRPFHAFLTPLQSSSLGFRYDTDRDVCVPTINHTSSTPRSPETDATYRTLKACDDMHGDKSNRDVYVCNPHASAHDVVCVPRKRRCLNNEIKRTCFSTEAECVSSCEARAGYVCNRVPDKDSKERRTHACKKTFQSRASRLNVYDTQEDCEALCSDSAISDAIRENPISRSDIAPWGPGVL